MTTKLAKPFLKWAGGKTQLLNTIHDNLPKGFLNQKFSYIEPFVGSGAVLFSVLNNFPKIERAIINDINPDLTNVYRVIASYPSELISILKIFQAEYHELSTNDLKKKEYYIEKRTLFNIRSEDNIIQAALFIFLNRSCFNGLYRVNRNNQFNVPIGSYKKPMICDENNILNVSKALQRVEIFTGDYQTILQYVERPAFFYFDPPYKPLSNTSSFNSYAKEEFGDYEQIRLRDFCRKLDSLDHYWMLSNSDVRNNEVNDNFFDDIYCEFNISRVSARRTINANPAKRGRLTELLITNYNNEQALSIA
ncbi:DNA adenine methylase [Flavobacterium sp. MK4S-17]|uniref:DNA adenine methylase n=1 Tax=Flavobacterium sp. MK4S-17 TaxID=2543737 RepID=UPI001359AEF5|nr:DNA adenine methylase [Flavobacterium sp. MK4S-17]